jgi:hypothetical protein
MIRLILEPQPYPHRGQYIACLEDGTELVRNSRTPLYDGVRALLKRGYPADTLLTIRHAGTPSDAWVPTTLAELARWSIEDGDRTALRRRKYKPRPAVGKAAQGGRGGPVIEVGGSEAMPAIPGP